MSRRGRGGGKGIPFGLGALSLGALASAAAGGYKLAEVAVKAKKLHEVAGENAVFVRLIDRVRLDLAEVERLLSVPAVKHALSRSPRKVAWINKSIVAMRASLEVMVKNTGGVHKNTRGGLLHAGLWTRMKWVLDEHEKLIHRQLELNICHQGLLQVLGFLTELEPLACCDPDTAYDDEEVYRGYDEPLRRVAIEEEREFDRDDEPTGRRVHYEEKREFGRAEEDYEESPYGREPAEETIRVQERTSYGREGPERETVRVQERRVYGREDEHDGVPRGGIRMEGNDRHPTQYEMKSEFSSSNEDFRPRRLDNTTNLPPIRVRL